MFVPHFLCFFDLFSLLLSAIFFFFVNYFSSFLIFLFNTYLIWTHKIIYFDYYDVFSFFFFLIGQLFLKFSNYLS
jgi:hypothetical protein